MVTELTQIAAATKSGLRLWWCRSLLLFWGFEFCTELLQKRKAVSPKRQNQVYDVKTRHETRDFPALVLVANAALRISFQFCGRVLQK